jgi:competence CoiA-like predicted nuclease
MPKFTANAHEIIPRLWLGNVNASIDESFIKKYGIQAVFNCTKDLPYCHLIPTKYRVPIDDNLRNEEIRNLTLWAPEASFHVIKEYKQGKTILIHCYAGMQRSAALTAMVLMLLNRWKADQAMSHIRSIRSVAFMPKANFFQSIKDFEQKVHGEILQNNRALINGVN